MSNFKMEFDKEILWAESKCFANLKPKQGKKGTYYQADMNNFLLVSNGVDQWGNIRVNFIPVKYTKKGQVANVTPVKPVAPVQQKPIKPDNEDVPFDIPDEVGSW